MIARNEINVIKRCLSSLLGYIDFWVIIDTGSEDGTQEAVRKTLANIPGELYERPWVDFAVCRNAALSLARGKGDYLLFIDADETFSPEPGFVWPRFDRDCYFAPFILENGSEIQRLFLAKNGLPWLWKGALHEELTTEETRVAGILAGAKIVVRQDGARSLDPKKYLRDAEMLEKDPLSPRAAFYAALSYDMAREERRALEAYQKRCKMGDWDEELFYAHYRSGCLQERLGESPVHEFCKALEARPQRAEPLHLLAKWYNEHGAPLLAYLLARFGLGLPFPPDRTFVEREVYDYKLLIQKTDAALLLGMRAEAMRLIEEILAKKSLPPEKRLRIESVKKLF